MAAVYYHDGEWSEENPKLAGPGDHALWLGSSVFDACRAINGRAPDLERHCERLIKSCGALQLAPTFTAGEIVELCREGVRRMPDPNGDVFIRPMFFASAGLGYGGVVPDPDSTVFTIAIYNLALPEPKGFSACFSSYRRPARDMAPTTAKTGALYPNSARAMMEAGARSYDNAVVLDPNGNVAEFTAANLFLVKNGTIMTPALNGTFLAGVTRRRVLELLRADGKEVAETAVTPDDVREADEVFSSGNYAKVLPCTRIEDHEMQPGPIYRRARELYFEWAATAPAVL